MDTLPSSSVGLKSDRTAAHAAVRDLAESFGVALLPLDLKTELTITPVRPHSGKSACRSCDMSRASSLQADPSTPTSRNEIHSLPRLSISSPKAAAPAATGEGSTVGSPAKSPWRCPQVACSPAALTAEAAGPAPYAAETSQTPNAIAAAAEEGADDKWVDNNSNNNEYLSEAEYIQYQVPLEQQLLSLEEERDILVDKLLATTAALHASEARNRESQASASQVAALLNQLQELLRRAELERDKAKMQLKRQRLSASCVPSDGEAASSAVAQPAAAADMSAPHPLKQHQSAPVTSASTAGSEPDNSSCTWTRSSKNSHSAAYTTSGAMQQRLLKKHKNNIGHSSSNSIPALEPQNIYEPPRAPESDAAAPEAENRRSSCGSGSSAIDQLLDAGGADGSMSLMPSSNEARPPVKSVIHGFEALMKQRARRPNTESTGGARRVSAVARTPDPSSSKQHGADEGTPADSADLPAPAAVEEEPAVGPPPNLQPVLVAPSSAAATHGSNGVDAVQQQQVDGSSAASTPTAAAIYDVSPDCFAAAEAAQAAAGVSHLEAAMATSYAEVAKRNSSELSVSSSLDGSRSLRRRAVRSPRIAGVTSGRDIGYIQTPDTVGMLKQTSPWDSSSNSGTLFAFGSAAAGSSKSSSSSSCSQSPCARSPTRHIQRHGSSRFCPAAAAESTQCLNGSSVCLQHQLPKLYNPAAYASSTADTPGPVESLPCSERPQQQMDIKFSQPSPPGSAQGQASSVATLGDSVRSNGGIDAAVQVVEPLSDCIAGVQASMHPAASAAAPRNLDGSGQTARSGCSSTKKKRAHGGQQKQKQTTRSDMIQVSPLDAISAETCNRVSAAGSKGVSGVSPVTAPAAVTATRSSGLWTVLKLVVTVILLLATGGVIASVLLQSMQPAQQCQPAETELQARLAAVQQEVVVLQRQLSEQAAACDATAAAGFKHLEL